MMPHRVLQPGESAVVKKRRLQGNVADRSRPKLIAVIRVARDLLQAEIFVLSRAVECHIAGDRRNLRDPNDMLLEVAEHLVGWARDVMAVDTPRPAKEKQRSLLFVVSQCALLPSRKPVNRSIGEDQGELELGDSKTEHIERYRPTGSHRGK